MFFVCHSSCCIIIMVLVIWCAVRAWVYFVVVLFLFFLFFRCSNIVNLFMTIFRFWMLIQSSLPFVRHNYPLNYCVTFHFIGLHSVDYTLFTISLHGTILFGNSNYSEKYFKVPQACENKLCTYKCMLYVYGKVYTSCSST